MARKVATYTVPSDGGRDAGKIYEITEMPASRAEKWGMRAVAALLKAGATVPPDMLNRGLQGIAFIGLQSLMGVSFPDLEPLMDEMFGCIQRVETKATRRLVEDDIEEVVTRLRLRSEVLELHIGFSVAAFLSSKWEAAKPTTDDAGPKLET